MVRSRCGERGEHMDLRVRIEHDINSCSAENGSNTPDFILAEYLMDCLAAYDKATKAREEYYGVEFAPGTRRFRIDNSLDRRGDAPQLTMERVEALDKQGVTNV
jgi:hypothetical protein